MSPQVPKQSRVFDALVLIFGLALGIFVCVQTVASGEGFGRALLCVPLVVLIARFPMLLDRDGGGLEVGFDSCVLMFLLCSVQPHVALTVWSIAVVATQLTNGKRLGPLVRQHVPRAVDRLESRVRDQRAPPRRVGGHDQPI